MTWLRSPLTALLAVIAFLLVDGLTAQALAHGVAEGDKGYLQETSGVLFAPFVYLRAKHMVTGYDHLLFLFGVIFFLYRLKDVSINVTMFAVGHSVTCPRACSRTSASTPTCSRLSFCRRNTRPSLLPC